MPRRRRRHTHTILLALVLAMLTLPGAGCATLESASDWLTEPGAAEPIRDALAQAEQESAALDQVIADAEAALATLPEGETRDEVLAVIADAKAKKPQADAVVADLRDRLAEADTGLDVVVAGLQSAGDVVPPPIGGYLAIAGTLLAGLSELLRRRTKKAAERVVISIEQTKDEGGGVVDFGDAGTKALLGSRMGTAARDLVEAAQAKARTKTPTLKIKAVAAPLAPQDVTA